ncbi:TIGR01620 family protein [Paraglaciecola sp.]|uniref:YcjF family protein n=1 Tax=Paraglaciecola sp. TaxID=1920173 RepID=UPI0030F491C9
MKNDKSSSNGQVHVDNPSLKPSLIVESVAADEFCSAKSVDIQYRGQQIIMNEQNETFLETAENTPPSVPEDEKSPLKKTKKWWVLAALMIIGLSVAEVILAISQVISTDDWLGAGWLIVLFIIIAAALTIVVKEVRSLKRLKSQTETRQYSADLFNTPAIGVGQEHCTAIGKQLPKQYQYLVEEWQNNLESHYTNKEVLSLFELKVLSPIDKMALSNIGKHSSASGVMIAVSPFALLDMLIVLWRNLVMINQLSRFYGVSLGYWGRIELIKKIFRSMLYAGAAEILSDAGNYALGVGLTGKISSRVAQGLGAGVLTSRIGLQALNECRPMPWLATKKPGLSTMTNKLLEDLSKYIK